MDDNIFGYTAMMYILKKTVQKTEGHEGVKEQYIIILTPFQQNLDSSLESVWKKNVSTLGATVHSRKNGQTKPRKP